MLLPARSRLDIRLPEQRRGCQKEVMQTLDQFVRDTVRRGGSINTMFEERLFALVGTLERIAIPLAAENVPMS
jgi:hypothetical protein